MYVEKLLCGHVLAHVLTYDGDRFASKLQSSSDAEVFATTSGRPQPHGVLTAEEHHQHDLLRTHTPTHTSTAVSRSDIQQLNE